MAKAKYTVIDGYYLDCGVRVQHSYESEVTEYPVESGSTITDNVRRKPIKVIIEGVVSDTPMGDIAIRRQVEQFEDGTFLPSDEALTKLLAIRDAGEPITIETPLKRFESMVLIDLDIPIDEKTGHALQFTATFQQLIIVTNLRTTIKVAAPNNAAMVKKSGPPVVMVDNPDARVAPVTKSGKGAMWNKQKGRYEYTTLYDSKGNKLDMTSPSGIPVPPGDIDSKATAATQRAADANSKEALEATLQDNNTYFDPQADEWRNTDGTAVTQEQLDAKPRPTRFQRLGL